MKKKFLSLCLALSLIATILVGSGFTTAASSATDLIAISNIAQNAANSEMGWPNATLSNTKPLYDFNGKLIAYSVDVLNNDTNQQGYELISTSPDDDPIMEFSKDAQSPYDSVSTNDICLFSGLSGYYSTSSLATDANSYDIIRNKQLSSSDISSIKLSDSKKDYKEDDILNGQKLRSDFSKNQKLFNLSVILNKKHEVKPLSSGNEWEILDDVPYYYCTSNSDFVSGCTPTAAAMALKYIYSGDLNNTSGDTMKGLLSAAMLDTPSTGTFDFMIPTGIYNCMQSWTGILLEGIHNTGYGRSNATWTIATQQIAADLPYIILDAESNVQYHNHAMCVVGYQHMSAIQYIVVHTGWESTGRSSVYINYNSATDLGSNFCFTLIPRSYTHQ
jgi:hypothetical protein